MESKKLKKQQGYLMILSAVIVVIIALITTLTLGIFGSNIKSAANTATSKSALYLANSALQIAKRDIIINERRCLGINHTLYTSPQSIPNMN